MAEMGFRLNGCTIQLRSGRFCDAPVAEASPFSVCFDHQQQIAKWVDHPAFRVMKSELVSPTERLRVTVRPVEPGEWKQPEPVQHFVYYVLMPHHLVKIGVSTNVSQRLATGLRVGRDALLAVEPGGYDVEARRHRQFRHLAERWHEEFRPAQELQDHVAALVKEHGEPWSVLDSAA